MYNLPLLQTVEQSLQPTLEAGVHVAGIVAVRYTDRNSFLSCKLQRGDVIEHALIIPKHIIFMTVFSKKSMNLPIIAKWVLAAACYAEKSTSITFNFFLICAKRKTAQKIELELFFIKLPVIIHDEIFQTANRTGHARNQYSYH